MQQPTYYGTKATATEIETFLLHILSTNEIIVQESKKPLPVCIWGQHGVGKSQFVMNFAQQYGYELAYIAPAQFEEMGDLLGMPKIIDSQTVFAPPAWVPTTNNKGIFLIDDVNRADDRILKGIMQLLQNHELISWKLPKSWTIILTANPDNNNYNVTSMDDAILTRMLHITMVFDPTAWSIWAIQNNIHEDAINFLLTHPETVTGQRSTPRTLVQFFENLRNITDWNANLSLIQMLGEATLDPETVAAFINFIQSDRKLLPTPHQILNATNFSTVLNTIFNNLITSQHTRIDLIATLCSRLIIFANTKKLSNLELENLKSFIKEAPLPEDLRFTFAQDLIRSNNVQLRQILIDPVIGKILLNVL